MSPTILRQGGCRFFFFSREEPRMHVHVQCGGGEAKFWLSPEVELARASGLDLRQLRVIDATVREHHHAFQRAWRAHFGG
ncbi:protein of unknown function [Thiohalospira halophila DSM 15071]|uniref:DUF4160 domain-containing protein n=1 Tax=Thiohalospira halophila DSM 15071 TaxID=1123397 RepID=A0A1I1T442_9GAMM|nr:DUF4160 domain-containing protein [Thiohalospira halophila]SFD53396.1 protein of unknown function [Thiohalospira halophila DSM 15071]